MSRFESEFEELLRSKLSDSTELGLNSKQTRPETPLNNAQFLFNSDLNFASSFAPSELRRTSPRAYGMASRKPRVQKLKESELGAAHRQAFLTLRKLGLSLEESFSLEELKAEWRRVAFLLHPDTNAGRVLEVDFSLLNTAYQNLKDAFKSQRQAA